MTIRAIKRLLLIFALIAICSGVRLANGDAGSCLLNPDQANAMQSDQPGHAQQKLLVLVDVTDIKAHGSGPKVQPLPAQPATWEKTRKARLVTITGTITQPIVNDLPF